MLNRLNLASICVFCGSSYGASSNYKNLTQKLGLTLAEKNITLIYGGASVGLMGELADAVLNNNGKL